VLAPVTSIQPPSAPATELPPPEVRDPPARPVTPPRREVAPVPQFEPIRWRRSRSVGLPWRGRLVDGVRLPAAGARFFTWDPVLRRAPNRPWRRVGNDRLVRTLMRVLADFSAAHPRAPRIGIGDLSRPAGGDFGVRYGLPGHVSHQNGLDADLYYPRLDRRERPPRTVAQIDRPLAQDLVDRFVRAGATYVFVGPSAGLVGPPKIVQRLAHHDNHLHVRLR
jgi:murein endopeptidase